MAEARDTISAACGQKPVPNKPAAENASFPQRYRAEINLPRVLLLALFLILLSSTAYCQPDLPPAPTQPNDPGPVGEIRRTSDDVPLLSQAGDEDIAERLKNIITATQWFRDIKVRVDGGVVFLDGQTEAEDYRLWAGEVAKKTDEVVAVVNRIQVTEPSPWDFSPAIDELRALWETSLQRIPRLVVGLLFLVLTILLAKSAAFGVRRVLSARSSPLLRDMIARLLGILLLLIGCYLVLQIAGLSGLAATVLGGTGIAGLIAGIAFRDILENYLASLLISIRNPFRIGDLVEIESHLGVVLKVTTRGTVLMNLDGNHVQIPNATVYKTIIRNYTANPKRRDLFEVGIGYENEAAFAQKIALEVLHHHPAVLDDPEPLVLVDRLGAAAVMLKIHFWYDGSAFNNFKVRSSVIRLVKRAFEENDISMPDEAREIIFPQGVPVEMVGREQPETTAQKGKKTGSTVVESSSVRTEAEGDLTNENSQIQNQGRTSRVPEEGESIVGEPP